MKIVYSDPKTGRSAQAEVPADRSATLLNSKINDTIDGSIIGLQGYKLKITGGTDRSGFPLVKGIGGAIKTRILKEVARSGSAKGLRLSLTVRGSTIGADTEQVNAVIIEYGSAPAIGELVPANAKGEEKKEGKEATAK